MVTIGAVAKSVRVQGNAGAAIWVQQAIGLWLLASFGSVLLGISLRSAAGLEIGDTVPGWLLIVGNLALWLAYGLGSIVAIRRQNEDPKETLGLSAEPLDGPTGIAIGAALQLAVLPALYFPIIRLFDVDPGGAAEDLFAEIDTPLEYIGMFVAVVIMAPLVEEIFYRGLLLGGLRRAMSDNLAILVSAAVFAAAHFQLVQFPGLLFVGIATGWLRVHFGRLGPAWVMHAAFNFTTFVILVLT